MKKLKAKRLMRLLSFGKSEISHSIIFYRSLGCYHSEFSGRSCFKRNKETEKNRVEKIIKIKFYK